MPAAAPQFAAPAGPPERPVFPPPPGAQSPPVARPPPCARPRPLPRPCAQPVAPLPVPGGLLLPACGVLPPPAPLLPAVEPHRAPAPESPRNPDTWLRANSPTNTASPHRRASHPVPPVVSVPKRPPVDLPSPCLDSIPLNLSPRDSPVTESAARASALGQVCLRPDARTRRMPTQSHRDQSGVQLSCYARLTVGARPNRFQIDAITVPIQFRWRA